MKYNYDQKNINKLQVTHRLDLCECGDSKHKSLFASRLIQKGEFISPIGSKEILDIPNYLTVQIGKSKHILLDPEYLQYINHSCNPNVFFDTTNMQITAIQEINIGEQLTFFYPSTEWSMAQGFKCLCGSKNCLRYIEGASHIPIDILKKYRLSDYIQSLI